MSNTTDKTNAQLATALMSSLTRRGTEQSQVNDYCTLAFAGKTYIAGDDSVLGITAVLLGKQADEFRKAKKAGKVAKGERFQKVNELATMVGRWLKKQERFSGRRVSIKTTGTPSISLVTRSDNNHKAKPKAKGAKDTGIKGVKDLASLLKYAVDNYGLETVQAAAAKLS